MSFIKKIKSLWKKKKVEKETTVHWRPRPIKRGTVSVRYMVAGVDRSDSIRFSHVYNGTPGGFYIDNSVKFHY